MDLHVDLVRNDLDRMVRQVVARAYSVHNAHVKTESLCGAGYTEVIDQVMKSEIAKRGPIAPDQLLASLGDRIASGYLYATNPHADEACEFRLTAELPIEVEWDDEPSGPRLFG